MCLFLRKMLKRLPQPLHSSLQRVKQKCRSLLNVLLLFSGKHLQQSCTLIFSGGPMDTCTQSAKHLSLLSLFFTLTLLLPLNACGSRPGLTSPSSTPQQMPTASNTVAPGTPQLTQHYDFTEQDSGRTVTYTVTSRFEIILNQQKDPKGNLQVSCSPAGTLGVISNLPSEPPPLYAVRYEGVQAGRCTIKNGTFLLTVKIINLSSTIHRLETKGQE
jgi:hypothetical protein